MLINIKDIQILTENVKSIVKVSKHLHDMKQIKSKTTLRVHSKCFNFVFKSCSFKMWQFEMAEENIALYVNAINVDIYSVY